jgi:hypothetical protein
MCSLCSRWTCRRCWNIKIKNYGSYWNCHQKYPKVFGPRIECGRRLDSWCITGRAHMELFVNTNSMCRYFNFCPIQLNSMISNTQHFETPNIICGYSVLLYWKCEERSYERVLIIHGDWFMRKTSASATSMWAQCWHDIVPPSVLCWPNTWLKSTTPRTSNKKMPK